MRFIIFSACLISMTWACNTKKSAVTNDNIEVPSAFLGLAVDTIITLDTDTYQESKYVVEYQIDTRSNERLKQLAKYSISTDTIITFDPQTFEETIEVVIKKVRIEQ